MNYFAIAGVLALAEGMNSTDVILWVVIAVAGAAILAGVKQYGDFRVMSASQKANSVTLARIERLLHAVSRRLNEVETKLKISDAVAENDGHDDGDTCQREGCQR